MDAPPTLDHSARRESLPRHIGQTVLVGPPEPEPPRGAPVGRFAWVPIPLLAGAIVVLWWANLPTVYESRALLLTLNLVFAGFVSVCIALLAGRGFLAGRQVGVLMLGCGALAWGVATVAASALVDRGANLTVTIHNLGVLLSAACHLLGVLWLGHIGRPARWLAAGYVAVVAAMFLLVVAALAGRTPLFFVEGTGGTPLRQVVLVAAVAMFAAAAWRMLRSHRREPSAFLYWYGLGLALLAIGLGGMMLQSIHGGVLGWTGRGAQMLGGLYMLVAAVASARATGTWRISPLNHLRDALRESETRYRSLFDNMTEGFALHEIITDAAGRPVDYRFLEVNPTFERLTGLACDAVVGRRLLEVLPETEPLWIETYGRVALTGEPAHFDSYSGRLGRWYEVFAYRPAAGQFAVIFTDVTERKQAEEALRRERSLLDTVMQATDVRLVFLDPEFHFVWVNPAYAESCRKTPEELVGKNHFELYPNEENEAIFRKVRDTGEAVFYKDKPFVFPDQPERGVTYWDWSLTPVQDADGQVTGLVFSLRETTPFKRAEEALRESERRFRTVADYTHDWEFWRAPDGTFVYISPSCEPMTGYTREEFLADADLYLKIVDPADRPRVAAHMRENPSESDSHELEFRIIRRDGRQRWLGHVCRPVFNDEGQPIGRRGSNRDITDRKAAEEALRELNETLEAQVAERAAVAERRAQDLRRMAAELGHAEHRERRRLAKLLHDDLQQMLVAAKMGLRTLGRRDAMKLHDDVHALDELLDECIGTSRNLTHELSPPVLQIGTLADIFEWLAEWFGRKHGLEVVVDDQGDLPGVPEHLRAFLFRAVRELLFNVVKHSGKMEARLMLACRDDHLVVEVEDEGTNFDPRAVEVRLENPESFGLFTIQERLEALEGRLEFEATPEGGARFRLVVPIVECAEPPDAAKPAPTKLRRAAAKTPPLDARVFRLLVVDDHAVVRSGFMGLLGEEPDFDVIGEAADGDEAILQAEALHPDAILMDVDMPRMNGIEATRRIKQQWPDMIVVGLSFHEGGAAARAMAEAGADAYISKHTAAKDVLKAVRAACSVRR